MPYGLQYFPWRKVKTIEASAAWWDRFGKRTTWEIELECGHFHIRKSLKPPKKLRCDGCTPEDP